MEDVGRTSAPDAIRTGTVRTLSLGLVWRLLRYPFMLLTLVFVPRMMGSADYGRYAYIVALFVLLEMATDLGMLQICGRFVPECESTGHPTAVHALFQGLLAVNLLLGLALAAGLSLAAARLPEAALVRRAWPWLGLLVALARIEGTFYALLYGLNRMARFSVRDSLRSAVTLLLVMGLYPRYGLRGALWALVLNEGVLLILGAWWTRAYLRPLAGWGALARLRPYLVFGLFFYPPYVLYGLMQRAGNLFVRHLGGGPEEVAYYDIANQFLLLLSMFLGLLLQTLLPTLTQLYLRDDRQTPHRWLGAMMAYGAVLAVLATHTLMWLGPRLLNAWIGPTFDPVLSHARVMTLALIPVLVAHAGMNYALLDKTPGVYTAAMALGMVGLTAGHFLWTPRGGALGACWATVAGYGVMGSVFVWRYRRRFRVMGGPFLAALAAAALLAPGWLLRPRPSWDVAGFALGSLLYVGLLLALRVIRLSDAARIAAAFRSSPAAETGPPRTGADQST